MNEISLELLPQTIMFMQFLGASNLRMPYSVNICASLRSAPHPRRWRGLGPGPQRPLNGVANRTRTENCTDIGWLAST